MSQQGAFQLKFSPSFVRRIFTGGQIYHKLAKIYQDWIIAHF